MLPLLLVCLTGFMLGVQDIAQGLDNKGQTYQPLSPKDKAEQYTALLAKDNAFTRFRTASAERPYASAFSKGHTKFYDSELNLIGERIRKEHPVQNAMLFLHRHFLLGSTGAKINGVLSLLCTLTIVIGLILWWQQYRRLPLSSAIPKKATRTHLFRSHITAGVVISVPFLILSYTGFHLVYGSELFPRQDNTMTTEMMPLQGQTIPAMLNEAQAIWPDKSLDSVVRLVERPSGKRRGKAVMTGLELHFSAPDDWLSGRHSMTIDFAQQAIIHKTQFAQLPFGEKLKTFVRPLHDGLNMPLWYSVLITFVSFVATVMLAFSAYTFFKRIMKIK